MVGDTLHRIHYPASDGQGARRRFIAALWVIIVVVVLLVVASYTLSRLSQYPTEQAASFRKALSVADLQPKDRVMIEKELLYYETDNRIKIWTAGVQAIGGILLLFGLVFTWRNLRATQAKLDIDREGQLTNRFTQAAGQLGAELKDGSPNIEVRLGGIYALARIADDSPKDYLPIMDVLTAYVRYNAPWPAPAHPPADGPGEVKPRADVQAILTILGRPAPPTRKLDLRRTDLRGAEFWDAHLEGTDFWGAHLEGAKLWGAQLQRTKLENAHLEGANLREAKLTGAKLKDVCLKDADLREADLTETSGLMKEEFERAFDQGKGAAHPKWPDSRQAS